MTLTGNELLVGYSKFLDDYDLHTSTGNGASNGTTIVDTTQEVMGDGRLVGRFIRIVEGTCINQVSRITSNSQATGAIVVAPPFSAQIVSGIDYEVHQYEPRKKFATMDSARISAADEIFKLVVDETITTDGYSTEYSIPPTMKRPALAYMERIPWSPLMVWNFLPSPVSDDGMSKWTAVNCTKSTYTRVPADRLVPKYGPACTEVKTAAAVASTLTCVVGDMINGVTATLAAGRTMTAALWVYCTTASTLSVKVIDDSGTLGTSNIHQGRGWEVLHVTVNVSPNNTTLLSVQISESGAGAITYFVNNSWFYYGAYTQINTQFFDNVPIRTRWDDTTRRFTIPSAKVERRQIRLIGKDVLTALGTGTTTQTTNTMELDETTAEILYASAATILFEQERISTQNIAQVQQRIASVKDRMPQIKMNWEMQIVPQRFSSPYDN